MTRDAFLRKLRLGLAGLPPQEVEDIICDYSTHFAESEASGRQETEVASALGDPARIARELRADAGLRRFETHWSVSNMFAAVLALGALAIVDILFLLPLVIVLAFCIFGAGIALFAIGAQGLKIIVAAVIIHDGGALTAVLSRLFIGAGLVSAFVGGGALLLLGMSVSIRMFGHYARLHFHLVKPAHDPIDR